MTCGHLLDDGPEEAVLFFKPGLIFSKEPVKGMEQHPVEHGAFRMSGAIDPCHSRSLESRNGPARSKHALHPYPPGRCRERPRLFASESQQEFTAISRRRQ